LIYSYIFQKSATVVQKHYSGNTVKALLDVFPNIGLDESCFTETCMQVIVSYSLFDGNLDDIGIRRKFFIEFASQKGSNALLPEFWYNVSENSIRNHKVW
jgi:hypothetical protein